MSEPKSREKSNVTGQSPNSEEVEGRRTRSGKKYSPVKPETGKESVDKIKRNLNFDEPTKQEKLQKISKVSPQRSSEKPEYSPEKCVITTKSESVSPSNDEDSGYATSNPQQPVGEVSLVYSDFSDFEDNEDRDEKVKVQKKNPDAYVEDTTKIRVQRRVSPPRSPKLVSTRPKPNIPITWSSPPETRQRITAPSPEKFLGPLTPPSTPGNKSDDSDMEWSPTPPEPWHARYVRPFQNCSTPIRDQSFDGDFGNFTPIVGRTPKLIVGDRADSEIGDEFNETNMFALTCNFSAIDASVLQASMVEEEESLEDDPDGNNDILAGINRIDEELSTEYVDRLATMI